MIVHVSCDHRGGERAARRVRSLAAAFLRALGRTDAELSVLLVGDRWIRALNRAWRGKDAATDVLSFPLSDPPGIGPLLGDVVMSFQTAVRRARAEGRSTEEELGRYLAHGVLHLLGYDHERAVDARRMAEKEAALARGEGLVGAALRGADPERWTRSRTSTSTRSRSGSTARGTRGRTSRAGSRR